MYKLSLVYISKYIGTILLVAFFVTVQVYVGNYVNVNVLGSILRQCTEFQCVSFFTQ